MHIVITTVVLCLIGGLGSSNLLFGQTFPNAASPVASGDNSYYQPRVAQVPSEAPSPSASEKKTMANPPQTHPPRNDADTPLDAPPAFSAYDSCAKEGCGDACDVGCVKCDKKKKEALKKAVAGAFKPLFYDNNFSYIDDPCYCDHWLGDSFKRKNLGKLGMIDLGGEYRGRYHNERNFRTGLNGTDDNFLLHRTRLFANWQVSDNIRVYGEYLDAVSFYEDFPARAIEESRSNIENLFIDLRLLDLCEGELWARVGRQELLYGKQRVISPLDWANTRRTFEGAKAYWKGESWDLDAFVTHPVPPVGANFLSTNESQNFIGAWAKYKDLENEALDFYFLRYDENDGAGFDYNTFGAVYGGKKGQFLWDCWGTYQFGEVGALDQSGYAYTCGAGYELADLDWKPTLFAYFDWASGGNAGRVGYNHLFPLAHKYLGFMDLYGRRNIQDLNFQLSAKPTDKLTLLMWWHVFWLQSRQDVPYSVVMTPTAAMPGGSKYLGQELDITASYALDARTNILLGYSHFFSGDFYSTNPSPGLFAGDADFFYTQYHVNF